MGLEAFAEDDAAFFFGRRRDTALLVANVFASPLTVVYGPSGAGKTSVLQAGVVPSLRERGLVASVHRSWTGNAVDALRAAVSGPGLASSAETDAPARRREVIVLDEFEDFFHDSADEELATALAHAVTRPGRASSVLISIRDDALAKLDRFEGRVPGLLDNVLRLDYLERDGAREAILGPRDRWNETAAPDERFEVEDALVDAVLDGVPAGQGRVETLLLQLVMTRLWEAHRAHGPYVLRHETFDALGGVDGIVEEYVTGKLDGLDPVRGEQAAEILEHLVTPSRLRLAQRGSDLAGFAGVTETELAPLLEELADSHILRQVTGADPADTRYEVRHDSLADAVLAWRTRYVTERELAAERRRFRRRMALVLAGAVLLAVVAAAATYAWTQRQTARSNALSAEAIGLTAIDPVAAVRTALEAVDAKSTDAAENALRTTVAQSYARGSIGGAGDPIADVDVAPDGRLLTRGTAGLAVRSPTGDVLRTIDLPGVQDAALCPGPERIVAATDDGVFVVTRRSRARLRGAPEGALLVDCARNGSVLVANEERVRVYSPTLRPAATIEAEELGVETAALSPNGKLAGIAGLEGVRVYAIPGGGMVASIGGPPATAVAFSPDNARVVTGDKNGRVVISALTGRRGRIRIAAHTQVVSDLGLSADGTLLVSAGTDRVARVWDAVTGDEIAVLRGHEGPLRAAAFGQGKTIVTVADDHTLRFWDAPVTAVLAGHTGRIVGLSVTPDGARVATAARDDTVRVWDGRSGRQLARLGVPGVSFVAISPDGRRLVTLQTDTGRAWLWDIARRRSVRIPVAEPASVAFTPDGRLVATAGPGRSIGFFGPTGRPVRSFAAPRTLEEAGRLAFSTDGERLAVAEVGEGRAVILDAETGSEIGTLPEEALRALSLTFSLDGTSLGTAESVGVARFWDAHDGSADPPALAGHEGAVLTVSFAPGSDLVATAGNDGTVRIWHVDTGEELLRLPGTRAAFASDADILVTSGPGTTAHVLPCRACGSISDLRERAGETEPAPGG